ncbi:MAG: hypothetical protein JKX76_03145 [Colwellia sp.]|nr:hypothetical protein [Colwellia sp.]
MFKRLSVAVLLAIAGVVFPVLPSFSQELDSTLPKKVALNLTNCKHGKQLISQWVGSTLLKLEGEFHHDDHVSHVIATIGNVKLNQKRPDSKKACKVVIYTYVEGADTGFECNFPLSITEFEFPAILMPGQAWGIFNKDSPYCQYVH